MGEGIGPQCGDGRISEPSTVPPVSQTVSQTNATASSCSWKSCSASARGNLLLAALLLTNQIPRALTLEDQRQSFKRTKAIPKHAKYPNHPPEPRQHSLPVWGWRLLLHVLTLSLIPPGLMKEIYPYLEHVALFNPRSINIGP